MYEIFCVVCKRPITFAQDTCLYVGVSRLYPQFAHAACWKTDTSKETPDDHKEGQVKRQ